MEAALVGGVVGALCEDNPLFCNELCRNFSLFCSSPHVTQYASTRFWGSFTGNLRDMTIELHGIPNRSILGSSQDGSPIILRIYGQTIELNPPPVSSAPVGSPVRYEISIPSLGCAKPVLDGAGTPIAVIADGFATENGTGCRQRQIRLSIGGGPWIWGASEFAAGITFNPTQLASTLYLPDPEHRADCTS